MAKDDVSVQLDDPDAPLTIEVPENGPPIEPDPTVLAEADEGATSPPAKKNAPANAPLPRVRLKEAAGEGAAHGGPSAAEEAAAALTASLKASEEARKAAEATANAERARAEHAQRLADQYRTTAESAQEQVATRELSIVSTGIETASQRMKALGEELTRYYEQAEFGKASDTQLEIGRVAAALDRLQETKRTLESGVPTKPTTEGRVEPPQNTNVFEDYVARFRPAEQSWLRAHPECVPPAFGGNPVAHNKMMMGHHAAEAEGIAMGTPEYFAKINSVLGAGSPMSAAAAPVEAAPPARAAAPPAPRAAPSAPPSREPPTANGIRPSTRQVTLTPQQQEAARLSFPHMEPRKAYVQYAVNLMELEAEGKMGRTTH